MLAGCRPIGVICEIMSDDGSMARLPELLKFSSCTASKSARSAISNPLPRTREKLGRARGSGEDATDYGDCDLAFYRSNIDGHIIWAGLRERGREEKRAGARAQRIV